MNKTEIIAKIKEIIEAPSCYSGLKEAAQKYIDTIGKSEEKATAKALVSELEADVNTIDQTIDFMASETAKSIFGAEKADKMLEDAKAFKAKGEKYCFCPACQAGAAVLAEKETIL